MGLFEKLGCSLADAFQTNLRFLSEAFDDMPAQRSIVDVELRELIERDLAILVHMDGQGTPAVKQQTWQAITTAAPAGVFFGWKDFYAKDHPMMTAPQTMTRTPQLSMISYQ